MNSTPHPQSGAYPQTPGTVPRFRRRTPERPRTPPQAGAGPTPPTSGGTAASRASLPVAPERNPPNPNDRSPLIPLTVLDAPAQRAYAFAIYCALVAYKLYDWVGLIEENTDGFWLFLKWISIDFIFLFGIPELRIPWLEFSQPVVTFVYCGHFIMTYMLMFNVGIPWQTWLLGMLKVFYDRELGILEHNVKVSNLLHNSSLISGRQIINILPEGSAVLNPEGTPFCLGEDSNIAYIPLQFNATIPIDVELVRVDLDTKAEETVKMGRSGIKEVTKMAKRQESDDTQSVVTYNFPIKKVGAYRLKRVLDEYKLEVQRTTSDTFVVKCPAAMVAPAASSTRCLGELSDLAFHVDGTPPLKIVYSRTTNGKDHSFHFQSLQPDGFSSPLLVSRPEVHEDGDVFWARSQRVTVSINESMTTTGSWRYSIDEVHDAFGNAVTYTADVDDVDVVPKPKPKFLIQDFTVNERPRAKLSGCDLRNPMKVANGMKATLPVNFGINGRAGQDTAHTISWQFSPMDTLTSNGDHGDVVITESYSAKNSHDKPSVSRPGLYTLKSVTCSSCEGEIQEPSSCMLINPLEPKLTLRAEDIPDKCAGNSVGLRVDMDLIGTPPFTVRYEVVTGNAPPRVERVNIPGLRFQMNLEPKSAGKHKYIFKQIDDAIYKGQPLVGDDKVLVTDVKPAASAIISHPTGKTTACLEEQVEADIVLLGDAPFTLEYELIHDGRRKQERVTGIDGGDYKIKTTPLLQGGEYTLALTSIQDKSGCRRFLKDELKISVRRQRPKASFGVIENKRKVMTIADSTVKLPIRLTGEAPWTVSYRNPDNSDMVIERKLANSNDVLSVKSRGVYEIIDIYDNQCHGTVDPKASSFEVDWFPRPELSLFKTDSISERGAGFAKQDVCEGDIDGFDVKLQGSPPYHVEYEIRHKPYKGGESINRKAFDAALGKASIQMDTGKAGTYTYKFSALADNLYNSDKSFHPLVLQQKVNAKPSVSFSKPGQSFKYCMTEQEHEDTIPISLVGVAPFSIDIEVKHQSGTQPETYTIPVIDNNSYGLRIPRRYLKLGSQQVRIRSVRDANGCQSKTDHASPAVNVHLFDAPAIYPLETRTDYCVGDRLAYSLSGTPPFEVHYRFAGQKIKAKVGSTTFKRIAEAPGDVTIESVADRASDCRADYNITKKIHPMPSVRISRGRNVQVDIHEGSEVEILFEFWGTPPFEFTYTRSTNARKGQKSVVLETRHDVSHEHEKRVMASQEGTYEVVAIKDQYCAFSTLGVEREQKKGR
ncbi:uncharacterized protein MKZ38_007469 [Zalerion maritima]|uniref:Nucleoporin Pom152 n=1 Tax=Zalerion maritima TaxID=339359 RepID=A0AAD5RWT8_9PEZI|nr:uncharacterized protein MKZ38_007469 [Zalerion maritima]